MNIKAKATHLQRSAEIKAKIADSDIWMLRGLLAIYKLQTADEKDVEGAKYLNEVGFSGAHAYFASEMAQMILRGAKLSPKQTSACRRIMLHYSGQLAKIANGEIKAAV